MDVSNMEGFPFRHLSQRQGLTLVALLCALLSLASEANGGCPKSCFCNTVSRIVFCSRRGLTNLPDDIPSDSTQLNMNGNVFNIPSLKRSNFSQFTELEHLYLSECGIETLEVDTFFDLVNLKWLDLSNNRLKIVQEFTFRGLNLQHLFLNGNRKIRLSAGSFRDMQTTGLYLHDCSIQHVDIEVLRPLNTTLRYLWLEGNELERLSVEFLTMFNSLFHLRLGSNPLHCNCESLWLKEFYDKNGDKFKGAIQPSCLTPSKLRGKFFNVLSLFEFRCQAPTFNNIDAVLNNNVGHLRCSATGDPAPLIFWIRPSGQSNKFTPPPGEDVRHNEGVLRLMQSTTQDPELSGLYICVAYNEAGNVTLTMNVTFPAPLPVVTIPSVKKVQEAVTQSSTPVTQTTPNHQRTQVDGDNSVLYNNKPSSKDRGYNYTALNMLDFKRRKGGRLFNLTELVGAVIGTHVCTLLVCLIFMPIYLKRQWRRRHHTGLEKNPNEGLFLNGHNHNVDFLDTPPSTCKR